MEPNRVGLFSRIELDVNQYESLERCSGIYETYARDARHAMTQGVAYVTISVTLQAAAATAVVGILSVWRNDTNQMPNTARIAGAFLILLALLVPWLASMAVERVERREGVARARLRLLEVNALQGDGGWPKVVDSIDDPSRAGSPRTAVLVQWLFATCCGAAWAGLWLWIGAVVRCDRQWKSFFVALATFSIPLVFNLFRSYRFRSLRHRLRDVPGIKIDCRWLGDEYKLYHLVTRGRKAVFGNRKYSSEPQRRPKLGWVVLAMTIWVAVAGSMVPAMDLGSADSVQPRAIISLNATIPGGAIEPSRLQDMILTPLAIVLPLFAQADKPISINRVFALGEKCQYEVKATLMQEVRGRGLNTWIPSEEDTVYKFTTEVKAVKADGVADVRYQRPKMTFIEGQTAESEPKPKVEDVNLDYLLTLSPINEVIAIKDLAPKKKKKDEEEKKEPGDDEGDSLNYKAAALRQNIGAYLNSFTDGLGGVLTFVGSPDSALDLSPKLPFEEVTPGYTWKKTGFFSASKLAGEDTKMAVQRIDFTYTYKGQIDVDGKKFLRVHAELSLDTSLSDYLHQMTHLKSSETHIKSVPFKLTSQLDFDLDPVTRRTVKAIALSSAEAKIITTDSDDPRQELKLTGKTTMKLLNVKN